MNYNKETALLKISEWDSTIFKSPSSSDRLMSHKQPKLPDALLDGKLKHLKDENVTLRKENTALWKSSEKQSRSLHKARNYTAQINI